MTITIDTYLGRTTNALNHVRLTNVNSSIIHAAANNLSAAGGGILELPVGTFVISNSITIPNNVHLIGQGNLTILESNASMNVIPMYIASNATNVRISNFVMDYKYNVAGWNQIYITNGRGVTIDNMIFRGGQSRPAMSFYWSNSNTQNGNILVENCRVENGNSSGLIWALGISNFKTFDNIKIKNNYVHGGGSMCLFSGNFANSEILEDTFYNVEITGNQFIGNGSGPYGSIPVELWGLSDSIVSDNFCTDATRGIGIIGCKNMIMRGNNFLAQNAYCFEIGASHDISILDNVGRNCKTLANFTLTSNGGLYTPYSNFTIAGNILDGTGVVSYDNSADAIKFTDSGVFRNINIFDNTFINIENLRSVIRIDGSLTNTNFVSIKNNYYRANTETSTTRFISIRRGSNIVIENNEVYFNANYTASNPSYNNGDPIIAITNSADGEDTFIKGNVIKFTGTTTGAGIRGIGQGFTANSVNTAQISIISNVIEGLFTDIIKVNSSNNDTVIMNNDITRATGNVVYGNTTTLKAVSRFFTSDAVPNTGIFTKGDFVLNSNSQYDVDFNITFGWTRLTSGNGHVANTDWRPVTMYSVY